MSKIITENLNDEFKKAKIARKQTARTIHRENAGVTLGRSAIVDKDS